MLRWHLYAIIRHNQNVQASGDRLQSKEDENVSNLLSPRVKLRPTTSQTGRVRRCKKARDVATYAARFRPGYLCFCGSGSEKTWQMNEDQPSHQIADGEWDKFVSRMISEFVFSKHPVFKCSNIPLTGELMKPKKGGGVGTYFKNKSDNHRMFVN